MRYATTEYNESLKEVDLSFDIDHYHRLIIGEPQTPALEDSVGFNQLDLIRTTGTAVGPSLSQDNAPIKEPTEALADQNAAPVE